MTKQERNQVITEKSKELQKTLKKISRLQDKSFQIDMKIVDLVAHKEQLDREISAVLFPEKANKVA